LLEHRSEAGDGGNFKKPTFEAAASSIAHLHLRGAIKIFKICQNKYLALWKTYHVVCAIQQVSGWTWSDDTGASITSDIADSWDNYVRHHPEAKPFCNKGWVHFHKVSELM
ncbi:hypothetical protein FA15DRAFT_553992, partial [Coprinopsis marcescibilis]